MKMALLEIMASGPQGQSLLIRRANLPWDEFRPLMHQLHKSGFVANPLGEEKWARDTWTLSEKGIEALGLWRRLSTLLEEEPLLKPVLMAW
jgi:predicted transcriptional regulator